jgi:hypothetical protein
MRNIVLKIEKGAFYAIIAFFLTLTLAACMQKLNVDTNGYYSRGSVAGKRAECVRVDEYYIRCGDRK